MNSNASGACWRRAVAFTTSPRRSADADRPLRQLAALLNEQEAVLGWQLKRDGARRGIVEVTEA